MIGWLLDTTGTGTYRSLLPWEHRRYASHLLRLAPQDRRTRFMGSVHDDYIARHARRALASSRSKVIGWFHDGALRGVVDMAWDKGDTAEAAFSVEALYRKQGVGSGLAERALRAARNRDIGTLTILTEADNAAMRRLGARFGATFVMEGCDVEGAVPTGDRSMLSVIFELAEEQRSLAAPFRPLWLAEA